MYKFKLGFIKNRENHIYYVPIKESIFDLIHTANIRAVKAQIDKGTSVNLRNDYGQTLLHYALLYNQVKIAIFLISQGADLDAEDNNGQKVKYLIQKRNPNLYNKLDEYTSLILEEQDLIESVQVKELGQSDDWCCIIL